MEIESLIGSINEEDEEKLDKICYLKSIITESPATPKIKKL